MEKNTDNYLADVRIETSGSTARIYLNGREVTGVIGYEIKHNTQETPVPILHLQVQCNLDIRTGMVPILPDPWSWFYKPKVENYEPRE